MLFRKKTNHILSVDIHSHLLPGIDDGVNSWEESLEILKRLQSLGLKKAITTPHIYSSVYPNKEEVIKDLGDELKTLVNQELVDFSVEAAAEYFVDESFLEKIESGKDLLTFGDKYVLIETSFITKPIIFEQVTFELKSRGYKPVLAHPERYQYLDISLSEIQNWADQGLLFQVTLASLNGYYGPMPKKVAKDFLKRDLIDFIGSDIHRLSQIEPYEKVLKSKVLNRAHEGRFLNHKLM